MQNLEDVLLKSRFEKRKNTLLILGILFDLGGLLTYVVPGISELFDMVWAPVAGIVYFALYGGISGALGGFFTFAEELIPFTDFIPTFTLTWIFRYLINGDKEFDIYRQKHLPVPAVQNS